MTSVCFSLRAGYINFNVSRRDSHRAAVISTRKRWTTVASNKTCQVEVDTQKTNASGRTCEFSKVIKVMQF